jgi:hypothetical protein
MEDNNKQTGSYISDDTDLLMEDLDLMIDDVEEVDAGDSKIKK